VTFTLVRTTVHLFCSGSENTQLKHVKTVHSSKIAETGLHILQQKTQIVHLFVYTRSIEVKQAVRNVISRCRLYTAWSLLIYATILPFVYGSDVSHVIICYRTRCGLGGGA